MKLKGVLVAVVALLGVCMFPGDASAEVLCPTGTVNADKKVGSYAECNIPKDEGKRDLLGTVNTIISVMPLQLVMLQKRKRRLIRSSMALSVCLWRFCPIRLLILYLAMCLRTLKRARPKTSKNIFSTN